MLHITMNNRFCRIVIHRWCIHHMWSRWHLFMYFNWWIDRILYHFCRCSIFSMPIKCLAFVRFRCKVTIWGETIIVFVVPVTRLDRAGGMGRRQWSRWRRRTLPLGSVRVWCLISKLHSMPFFVPWEWIIACVSVGWITRPISIGMRRR